eukprot:TRINITY_DN2995_c0_g1_i3.p2 TRINITY_DN2995_c0_g1~~TRINITY_DN2995_c0_g1_i3.p2  ORF type:complete len:113 (-),score=33.37 TRINITY_DN2995_c0_g1_i3:178-516(-)
MCIRDRTYFNIGVATMALALGFRHFALRKQSPTLMWSIAFLCPLAFYTAGKSKIDNVVGSFGHRRTLEEDLAYSPITLRAWKKAMNEINAENAKILAETAELERNVEKQLFK